MSDKIKACSLDTDDSGLTVGVTGGDTSDWVNDNSNEFCADIHSITPSTPRGNFTVTLFANSEDPEIMKLEWMLDLIQNHIRDDELLYRILDFIGDRIGKEALADMAVA